MNVDDERELRKEVNAIINKVTLQNAHPLLQQLIGYYQSPERTTGTAEKKVRYSPSGTTDAIKIALLQHLTSLGDGELMLRAPILLPLGLCLKAIQIFEGSYSPGIIIKAVCESFMQRIIDDNPPLSALQNLTIFFCLLFELDVYDFQFISTFSVYLANLLRSGQGCQKNIACELLLVILRICNDRIHRCDPSWIPLIIDLATDSFDHLEADKSLSSRMRILTDFLREIKYKKFSRQKKRFKRSAPVHYDNHNHKLGTSFLSEQIDFARSILVDFSRGFLKMGLGKDTLRDGKLSITWEQCVDSRNARWWCNQSGTSVAREMDKHSAAVQSPLYQEAILKTKFPFDSHPYRNKNGPLIDNRLDTPVRIRFWNSLLESENLPLNVRHGNSTKEFAVHLLQKSFATFKLNETSLKKSIDKYARDFLVVFDVLVEKMSIHFAHQCGAYLFERIPFLTVVIQYICQESREFRFLLQSRLVVWMEWISNESARIPQKIPCDTPEQLLLLLVQSQYTAIYVFHQRSPGSFLAKNPVMLKSQADTECFRSRGHLFMNIQLTECPPGLPDRDLKKSEIFYVLLFACLFIIARSENEFYQVFHPLKCFSKKKTGHFVEFLVNYFISKTKFLLLFPLIEMQWKSLRLVTYSQNEVKQYLVSRASKLCSWLEDE